MNGNFAGQLLQQINLWRTLGKEHETGIAGAKLFEVFFPQLPRQFDKILGRIAAPHGGDRVSQEPLESLHGVPGPQKGNAAATVQKLLKLIKRIPHPEGLVENFHSFHVRSRFSIEKRAPSRRLYWNKKRTPGGVLLVDANGFEPLTSTMST